MKKVSIILIFTLYASIIFVGKSFGNGVLLDGLGPISNSRGATNIAHNDNGSLIHDNPSALAEVKGKRIEGGFDFLTLSINYQDADNNQDGKETIFALPSFSYTQKIGQSSFGMGLGVFNPAGFSTEYHLVHPVYGQQKYASDSSLTKILFGLGWKINELWSFGIGLGPAYSQIKFEEPYTFQTGLLQKNSALVSMEGDNWTLAWNMGVQWQVTSSTTMALAYINQDTFAMDGDLHLQNPIDPNGTEFPIPNQKAHYSVKSDFQWPQILGAGVTHQFKTSQRISIDALWIDWSSAFDQWVFKLSGGDNPYLPVLAQDTFPLNWKDSYSLRLGYEYFFTADTIRVGYSYNRNPIPDTTLKPLIPGILTHLVAFGYSRNRKNLSWNVAYQYSFGPRQFVNTSEIKGGDYNNSSLKARAQLFAIGVQYQF